MITSAFISYFHFLAAFIIVSSIVFEWITFNRSPTVLEAKRIQIADTIYGASAGLVLFFGILRILYYEKGLEYYLDNPFFQLKVVVFITIGLLSIYPTIRFIMWRKSTKLGDSPVMSDNEFNTIFWILRLEVSSLLIIILAASFMAKGIGV